MRFYSIHKFILVGLLLLTLPSCSLPPYLSLANNVKTGIDGLLMIQGEKTTNDRALSSVTEKDCRIDRILHNKEICEDEKTLPSKTRAQMLEELRHSLDQQEGVSWEYRVHHW